MTSRSLASWVVLLVLALLAILQIIMQLSFWGGLAGDDVRNAWLYQAVGSALTVLELFMLVIASELAAAGDQARANAMRGLFVVLALVNLAADLSAVSQFTGSKELQRRAAIERYQATKSEVDEAKQAIENLRWQLDKLGLSRPKEALVVQRGAIAERAARYTASGQSVPIRLIDQLAQFDTAIIIAGEIETKDAGRVGAAADLAGAERPTEEVASPFGALARLAHIVGARVEAEDVRAVLAFAVALVVKLSLTLGLWCLAPSARDLSMLHAAIRPSDSQPGGGVSNNERTETPSPNDEVRNEAPERAPSRRSQSDSIPLHKPRAIITMFEAVAQTRVIEAADNGSHLANKS